MATKSDQKNSNKNKQDDGMFNSNNGSTGLIVGAAVAGAAVGLAANAGRKLFMQLASGGAAGDWFETIKVEHQLTRTIFDKMEETEDDQTGTRSALLAKLKYALTKHALEEENVLYPALRQANQTQDADHLGDEHGYVKTYLYELEVMPKDSPEWLARVRDFRAMIEDHMREEEEDIFPRFHRTMSADQNKRITGMMNKEGFKFA